LKDLVCAAVALNLKGQNKTNKPKPRQVDSKRADYLLDRILTEEDRGPAIAYMGHEIPSATCWPSDSEVREFLHVCCSSMAEVRSRASLPIWLLWESGLMQLYCASAKLFTEDVLLNRIAEKLKVSFFDQIGRRVSPNEMNAWRNSLQSFAHVLSHFQLMNVGVALEMQLPLTSKRLVGMSDM
jgi:hypothetical protein